jgi:hypothetical protein
MFKINRFMAVPVFLSCMATGSIHAQTEFRIEDRMSAQERQAAGIDGLTAAELDTLNGWLQRNVILQEPTDPGVATGVSATELPEAEPEVATTTAEPAEQIRRYGEREAFRDVISVIRGTFNGWDGNTVFKLDYGQVYQQRRPGRWKTTLTDPEVRITRGFLGMMELEVDGHSIGVKRLQ